MIRAEWRCFEGGALFRASENLELRSHDTICCISSGRGFPVHKYTLFSVTSGKAIAVACHEWLGVQSYDTMLKHT